MLPILIACALAGEPSHRLDKLTVGDCVSLHGQVVRVTFTVGLPVDEFRGWAIAGVDAGGVEMGVMVPNGAGVWQKDTVTVIGVLRVVNTPAAVVNGIEVPAFTSMMVTGLRVR